MVFFFRRTWARWKSWITRCNGITWAKRLVFYYDLKLRLNYYFTRNNNYIIGLTGERGTDGESGAPGLPGPPGPPGEALAYDMAALTALLSQGHSKVMSI